MTRRSAVSEQDVAATVVAYLEAMGATVFQEVEVVGGVADIVARVRAEIWIVEVKTAPSLGLLYQAVERRPLAHRVYVAVPCCRGNRFDELCRDLGIGMLEVRTGNIDATHGWDHPAVCERVDARRLTSHQVPLAARLEPEHQTHARAGAPGARGRWTPFRRTCERLAGYVRMHPGVSMRDAVAAIEHHYSSGRTARTALVTRIEQGIVPGVRLERLPGGGVVLQPEASEARG